MLLSCQAGEECCVLQVNYYIGVHMSTHLSGSHRRNWYAAYSLVLGVIVALWLAKEVYNATVLRRKQQVWLPIASLLTLLHCRCVTEATLVSVLSPLMCTYFVR
jgi:hypothetical protein